MLLKIYKYCCYKTAKFSIFRYGIKGSVYLKSKEGQVLYVTETDEVEWTGGSVTKHDTYFVVDSTFGQQKYHLLDHITVNIL